MANQFIPKVIIHNQATLADMESVNLAQLSQAFGSIPHDGRTAESITTFRRHLKPHLFKEYLG
jgi:hypothetical protein